MAAATTSKASGIPHEDRTAAEPRENDLHPVILHKIDDVNANIKLYKLRIRHVHRGVKFHPGQWLDVFVPGLQKAGGFTLTSTPSQASPSPSSDKKPFLELAVQRSPENPPAAWLWRPAKEILGSELNVRVGGSFTWPPYGWSVERTAEVKKVIFVAGGVGINPLMSMLSSMFDGSTTIAAAPQKITFLYSTKLPAPSNHHEDHKHKQKKHKSNILFLPRLLTLAEEHSQIDLTLFLTGTTSSENKIEDPESLGWFHDRRIERSDLTAALGGDLEKRKQTVVYVCGPPIMTDGLVDWFKTQDGMSDDRVLCEKWW